MLTFYQSRSVGPAFSDIQMDVMSEHLLLRLDEIRSVRYLSVEQIYCTSSNNDEILFLKLKSIMNWFRMIVKATPLAAAPRKGLDLVPV